MKQENLLNICITEKNSCPGEQINWSMPCPKLGKMNMHYVILYNWVCIILQGI